MKVCLLKRVLSAGLLALVISFVTMWPAPQGHSGADRGAVEIFRGREGAYEITLGVRPEKPVVGTIHFSITPLSAETSELVPTATIRIVANNPQGEPTYQARALNFPVSPQYYDADLTIFTPGPWTIFVEISSDSLGEATFKVPLLVEEQRLTPNRIEGTIVWLILIGVLVGGAVYVCYSARRRRRASDPDSIHG